MRTRPLAVALCGTVCLGLAAALGQPPAGKPPTLPPGVVDEKEDPAPPKAKKPVLVEDEAPVVNVPKGAHYARIEEIARAALDAKTPAMRELLAKYVVAFDRLTDTNDKAIRVTPIPVYRTDPFPEEFSVVELDERNEPQARTAYTRARMKKVEHYEELLVAEADKLVAVQQLPGGDAAERYAAAELLVGSALYFHEAARDLSKRKGRGWEAVRVTLTDKLAAARLARLTNAAERKDWKLVKALGTRMAQLYPNNGALLEKVFAARLAEAIVLLQTSEDLGDLQQARDLLSEFEARFPGSKSDAADRVRAALKQKAERLLGRAEGLLRTDEKEAQRLVRTIELIDPSLPGLRDVQGQIKTAYTILFVGTRQLPRRMTPLTARTDSEKQAVELLFEGPLEAVPDDPHGVRFRPSLAATMPAAGGLAREFALTRQADWAGLPGEYCEASDVAGTLNALRTDFLHTWPAARLDWLAEQTRVDDRDRVRVGLAAGHPLPLSLFTTKILPARWLASQNKKLDDAGFARQPNGTGPYKATFGNQKEVVFTANPNFARRPGRIGQPFIKEVRFVDVTGKNLVAEFKAEQLHVLTDVPTADLRKYTDPAAGLTGRVDVVTAANNRRFHVLAVNHRRPQLQSVALRRGISYAIDREEILNRRFRASGQTQFHRPMTGPFPPGSWAEYRPLGGGAPPLSDKNLAAGQLAEHVKKAGPVTLKILVPADDLDAREAVELLRRQVNDAGNLPDGKVTLEVEAVAADEFDRRVYAEGGFDLAYVPFEYPDDFYPFALGALLDPSAVGRNGRNFMGFQANRAAAVAEDEALSKPLAEIRLHADFTKLSAQTQNLDRPFRASMPFIPLWQLDRHTVVARQLRVFFDDGTAEANKKWLQPTTLFAGVARWRLE